MSLPQGLLPLIALRNTVIFPGLIQNLKVGRERSIKALKEAEKNGYWIVAVQQKQGADENINPDELFTTGTLCRVESIKGNAENGFHVVLKGMNRVHLEQFAVHPDGYLSASSTLIEDAADMHPETHQAVLSSLKKIASEILEYIPGNHQQISELIQSVGDLSYLISLCVGNLDLPLLEKQKILEIRDLKERSLFALQALQQCKETFGVQSEIRQRMNQKFGQTQRQTILREQLKAIREELGDTDSTSVEEKLQIKIDESKMPEETRKVAQQELKRLSEIGPQSPESHIIRNYLELLTDLPWGINATETEIDLELRMSSKVIISDLRR